MHTSPVLDSHVLARAEPTPFSPDRCTVFLGRDAVLAQQEMLNELSSRCGQEGAMEDLAYYFTAPWKVPCLLVLRTSSGEPWAAALFFQYRLRGFSTGVYVPGDYEGERNVVAPPAERAAVARHVTQYLLDRGANLTLITLMDADFAADPASVPAHYGAATRFRQLAHTLPVAATFDATLAPMGAHTRRNLRAARRRCQKDVAATFVAVPEISEAEFLAFNRLCTYSVTDEVARWRYASARAYGLFVGLRAGDGSWLSIVGGRHSRGITHVDWQMNHAAFPQLSLGTATRSWLIEYEISRGTTALRFEGGTPHSMGSAFRVQSAGSLMLVRRWLPIQLLRKLLPILLPKNFLVKIFCSPDFHWHTAR
jgi:hypothetical protein